jgi:F-type H+-transporting ATPase subunit gamma
MATLRDIRRRISSVQKTQQITRAMQMVAAAKLRRAQEAAMQWRSYTERTRASVERLVSCTSPLAHPLLAPREILKAEILVITSERGLCGGFNLAICQKAEQFVDDNKGRFESVTLTVVGKKGQNYFRRRPAEVRQVFGGVAGTPEEDRVKSLAESMRADYEGGTFDALYLFYHRFKSVLRQVVVEERVLPLKEVGGEENPIPYLCEPDRTAVLQDVLPRYLEARVGETLFQAAASEHAARMSAMDLATKNAREMIGALTLTFNKARQEAITKELMDIVGGAEALR